MQDLSCLQVLHSYHVRNVLEAVRFAHLKFSKKTTVVNEVENCHFNQFMHTFACHKSLVSFHYHKVSGSSSSSYSIIMIISHHTVSSHFTQVPTSGQEVPGLSFCNFRYLNFIRLHSVIIHNHHQPYMTEIMLIGRKTQIHLFSHALIHPSHFTGLITWPYVLEKKSVKIQSPQSSQAHALPVTG